MPTTHPRTYQKAALRAYAGLLFLTILIYALMYAPQPMFNAISLNFGTDKSTTGLLVSVHMLSLAISPLCIGMILGKAGSRRVITISCLLLGLSGAGVYLAPSFGVLLAMRAFQALLVPATLTAIMTSVSSLFRHLDLNRAMAGYVMSNLVGSTCGRVLGGWSAEFFGWRGTLTGFCVLLLAGILIARMLHDRHRHDARVHKLAEYLSVFRQPAVKSLIFAEACGIFAFAAIGNLIPFRMAELGQGDSEGLIGLMYLCYLVGLLGGLGIGPLMRLFKQETRLILFGSTVYVVSVASLAIPSLWALFGGLWVIAFGQFVVHALCPGVINNVATRSGECDRGMVNGLFISCYYMGGVLGSYLPGLLYTHFGWMACYLCLQGVQIAAFLVLLRLRLAMPDLRKSDAKAH